MNARVVGAILLTTLQGMRGGDVELLNNRGQVVRAPMQDLSPSDQQRVASRNGQGYRLWSDNSGRKQRNGKFDRVEGRSVVLETKGERGYQLFNSTNCVPRTSAWSGTWRSSRSPSLCLVIYP